MVYKAVLFEAPQGSEVVGMLIYGYFDNLANDELAPILQAHGVSKEDIRPDEWYPLQIIYDISKAVRRSGGDPVEVAIGKAVGKTIIGHYQPKDIEDYIVNLIPVLMTTGMRNIPKEFGVDVERVGHQHYKLTNNTPSSNAMLYGVWWEVARTLAKPGERFSLQVASGSLDVMPGVFEISWG